MNLKESLNPSQLEAVEYCDGPALVIAGAGSGKTRVLTFKVAYLVENGMEAGRIMALTFTNKAAREMKERIASLLSSRNIAGLWIGTFHSLFLRILRIQADKINYTSNFTIYDTDDSIALVRRILRDFDLKSDKNYKPTEVFSRISSLKNRGIIADDYENMGDETTRDKQRRMPYFAKIFREYTLRCRQNNAMDFDDILINTLTLFKRNNDVLTYYQERFDYFLVDEYQDTNSIQHKIMTLLAARHKRLCVVGDDAQSIYSFRGARIDNILKFKNDFPTMKIFKLEQNYRSTQLIVDAANSLINKNTNQISKSLYSFRKKGDPLSAQLLDKDADEATFVASKIGSLIRSGSADWRDIAVLYRTNSQSRVFEDSFRKFRIPYSIIAGISFYQRSEIKDAIAYLRLAINPYDVESMARIINMPARGIGDTTLKKILNTIAAHPDISVLEILKDPLKYGLKLTPKIAQAVKNFSDIYAEITPLCATATADVVLAKTLSLSTLTDYYINDESPEGSAKRENLEELFSAVKAFVKANASNDPSIAGFLSEVALITDQDKTMPSNSVQLMTVHASKGLEFNYVFIVGMEEGLFPIKRAIQANEIEEERRLCYVAITRAKERCFISLAKERYANGEISCNRPSRFLFDIDERFIELPLKFTNRNRLSSTTNASSFYSNTVAPPSSNSPSDDLVTATNATIGDEVVHATFGRGKIIRIFDVNTTPKITILFEENGVKTLLLNFARLKKI